jgi:decaprenyl-phosphate phosphoribosyltransferase
VAVLAAAYGTLNLAYSVKLKHVAFVDVAVLATGFLLRVLAGAEAISVRASLWLLLCTSMLAAMLGLGKRAHELAWAQRSGTQASTRAALAGYRLPWVRAAVVLLGLATSAAYAMYCRSPHTVAFFGTDQLIWTAPFPALGILRFTILALFRPSSYSPTEAMLRDPWFLINLAAWGACVLWIVYGAG